MFRAKIIDDYIFIDYFPINEKHGLCTRCILKPKDATTVEICDFETRHMECRGKGYGSKLLEYVINYAKNEGFTNIIGGISHRDEHERLKKWYAKYGFTVTESTTDYVYDIVKIL